MPRYLGVHDDFAKRLLKAMVYKGMNQADLAAELYCSQSKVSLMLHAKQYPDYVTLVQIAKVMDVSLDWLCMGRGEYAEGRGRGSRALDPDGRQNADGANGAVHHRPRYLTRKSGASGRNGGDIE